MFCCSPAKVGITPAYAGKSLLCMDFCPAYRDHPRVCGEKIWLSSVCVHASGSPPRMRGKVPGLLLQHLTHGITPAYAGKSFEEHGFVIGVWDHPRVCGEKLRAVVFGNYSEGITPAYAGKRWRPGRGPCQFRDHPRVCGEKLRFIMFIQTAIGITPAYAGKSMYRTTETLCCRDHPRVCGEKFRGARFRDRRMGSPPRMRGKAILCAAL